MRIKHLEHAQYVASRLFVRDGLVASVSLGESGSSGRCVGGFPDGS